MVAFESEVDEWAVRKEGNQNYKSQTVAPDCCAEATAVIFVRVYAYDLSNNNHVFMEWNPVHEVNPRLMKKETICREEPAGGARRSRASSRRSKQLVSSQTSLKNFSMVPLARWNPKFPRALVACC